MGYLWSMFYAIVYFFVIDNLYGILQMFTVLSISILNKYNGERGKWKGMKWLFYIYYPAHLFTIGIIRTFMGRNGISLTRHLSVLY